jgi:hypothetical protein
VLLSHKSKCTSAYSQPLDKDWKAAVLAGAKDVLRMRATRSNTTSTSPGSMSTAAIASKIDGRKRSLNLINEDNNHRHHNSAADTTTTTAAALGPPPFVLSAPTTGGTESHQYQTNTDGNSMPTPGVLATQMHYWNSQDASNLFGVKLERPEDDVRDTLRLRIKQLQSANPDNDGWRNVIEGRDPDNICSSFDIFAIRGRSLTLCLAYQIALDRMNLWTWESCCAEACRQINQLGVHQATHHRTVQDWNTEFHIQENFFHPDHNVRCGKRPMPPLFAKYPMAMD